MNKKNYVYLAYQKDFSESGNDRYFLYEQGSFSEVEASYITSLDCFLVTHDFWLISNSLYQKNKKLPRNLIDVVLLSKIIMGNKSVKGDVQAWDISKTIRALYKDAKDFDSYLNMYYRRSVLDESIYMLFSHKLAEYTDLLLIQSEKAGEIDRFFNLEIPVYNELMLAACQGIRVNNNKIREYKERLRLDFYRELKQFAEQHKVLYELPNEGAIKEKLGNLGYDVSEYNLDFLIDFLPSNDEYTNHLRSLQKTNKSYRVFNSISSSTERLRPMVESHWTSTSRIYLKSPSIQNISKKYRDIFVPDDGLSLCYVDYDQFEVGVMAALSDDPQMKSIYENTDTYKNLAEIVFNDTNLRKKAKILFLSYTYGMSLDNIMNAVSQLGGDVKKAQKYFSKFNVFENWKLEVYETFEKNGRIPTISANYLNRQKTGELTDKERRTAVNHVIQGTATYIFKKAMLELNKIEGIQLLIPMHDAVLFQHPTNFDPKSAVEIFEDTMTIALNKKIIGKASIEAFFQA